MLSSTSISFFDFFSWDGSGSIGLFLVLLGTGATFFFLLSSCNSFSPSLDSGAMLLSTSISVCFSLSLSSFTCSFSISFSQSFSFFLCSISIFTLFSISISQPFSFVFWSTSTSFPFSFSQSSSIFVWSTSISFSLSSSDKFLVSSIIDVWRLKQDFDILRECLKACSRSIIVLSSV